MCNMMKLHRLNKGVKQRDIFEKTGIHLSRISHIENGVHIARKIERNAIADILGVSVSDIFLSDGTIKDFTMN